MWYGHVCCWLGSNELLGMRHAGVGSRHIMSCSCVRRARVLAAWDGGVRSVHGMPRHDLCAGGLQRERGHRVRGMHGGVPARHCADALLHDGG